MYFSFLWQRHVLLPSHRWDLTDSGATQSTTTTPSLSSHQSHHPHSTCRRSCSRWKLGQEGSIRVRERGKVLTVSWLTAPCLFLSFTQLIPHPSYQVLLSSSISLHIFTAHTGSALSSKLNNCSLPSFFPLPSPGQSHISLIPQLGVDGSSEHETVDHSRCSCLFENLGSVTPRPEKETYSSVAHFQYTMKKNPRVYKCKITSVLVRVTCPDYHLMQHLVIPHLYACDIKSHINWPSTWYLILALVWRWTRKKDVINQRAILTRDRKEQIVIRDRSWWTDFELTSF